MKTFADLAMGVIHAEIEIKASPERVFSALTDPMQLVQWWGADDYYRTHDWISDLREGGERSGQATGKDGKAGIVRGAYLCVEPPHRLAFTWAASWDDFTPTTVRVEIQATPAGSLLRIEHSGFAPNSVSCQGHTAGWGRVLGWLKNFLPN